ncbi:uncharacterized protein [Palaemon carinicauda]|uniref:uncharacterized protein isoform X1 n=1 Tax=Palaemon carinicauda TaxID=392227 RepID=UPI0035B5785D
MASSGNEQQLRFRWNDHMQHISKVLTLQRFEEQFCDVTLVSDDGFVMKAHQAILASTSTYFQRVLADITADQHPMIVLRGANFREMSCLLDYMYQGSTQVHQSLMETVLEVADMLEVKGLSQIRSNNSIKKFMAPPSSNSTSDSTTTSSHAHPVDNTSVGLSRPSDEQSGPHTPEDQGYRDSQSRSSDLEGSWMRFSGNNVAETRSKESSSRSISEGAAAPSEEPPPSSHVPLLSCQETSNQETQEESQVSGMDLSMAKNEPWSPRETSPNDDKNSPARKRRKLLETISTDETSELASDPDWGRTGSKVEERSLCHPRTISFTSITSEPGPSTEDLCSIEEDSKRCSNRQSCQQDISACEVSSHYDTCSCKGKKANHASKRTDERTHQIERNEYKETQKLEPLHAGNQSVESCFHSSNSFINSCSTKPSSNLHIQVQELPGIEIPCTSKAPHDNALLQQSSYDERTSARNVLEEELNESYVEKCNVSPATKYVDKKADTDIPQSLSQYELAGGLKLEEACTETYISVGSSQHDSRVYIAEEQESFDEDSEKEVIYSITEFSPVNAMNASTSSFPPKNVGRPEDNYAFKPVDAKSGWVDRDPLEIPVSYAENTTASSNEGEDARVTSFVSVMHQEGVMVKHSITEETGSCPLEERLVRPKSKVKRPLNPYMLFQNEMKKKVMNDHPGEHYQVTLKRLGIMWKYLTYSEKQKWHNEAENLKREHQLQNPDYYYNPHEASKKRQEYLTARMERNRLYRVSSESSIEDNRAKTVSPKS